MRFSLGSELIRFLRLNPISLVDVGASGGLKENWKRMAPMLRVIGFEPDPRAFKELSDRNDKTSVKFVNTALYEETGKVDFYMTKKQQLSSIFRPNQEFLQVFRDVDRYDLIDVVKIDVDTIDNRLKSAGISDVDFIKLDTQGSELAILKGAEDFLLNSVFGVEIEVEFSQLYQEQPLFSDVDKFLRKFGFELFDLAPCYWIRKGWDDSRTARGQAIFGDVLYFKTGSGLEKLVKRCPAKNGEKVKLLKAISICLIYGNNDYALEMLERNRLLFSEEEQNWLGLAILKTAPRSQRLGKTLSKVRGMGRLADAVYLVWRILAPKYLRTVIYLRDGQRIERF